MIGKILKAIRTGEMPEYPPSMDEYWAEEPKRPLLNTKLFEEKEPELLEKPLVEITYSVSKPFAKTKRHIIGEPLRNCANSLVYIFTLLLRSAPYGKIKLTSIEGDTFYEVIRDIQKKKLAGNLYSSDDSMEVLRYVLTRGPVVVENNDEYFMIYGFDGDKKNFLCFDDSKYDLYYLSLEEVFKEGGKAYTLEHTA